MMMCGIAGFLRFDDRPAGREPLKAMIGQLRHRGPDDEGTYVDGALGLGHTRLSIVDLAGGHQPLSSEDGTIWIVFNGEIFNHVELREQLEHKGHRFRTHSDTEVIVNAWREKGPACVEDFNGQWAFALWDRSRRTLMLSRDRLGVRPLFLRRDANRLAFASEIKALLALPDVPRALDVRALDELLTFWSVPSPRTIFEGIEELPPGHSMLVENGRTQTIRYWQLHYAPDHSAGERVHARGLLEALVDATRIRLRADVPVGAYLSGGLDSSLIAALVRRYTGTRLKTFSVTFESSEFDESRWQDEAIRYLEVDHRQLPCTAEDIGRVFPSVVWHAEQPMVRTAPAPLFLLSRLVRESAFKVVLTGEGSDEMFGGYDIFKEAKIRRFWAAHPDSTLRPLLLRKLYPYMPALQSQHPSLLASFFHVDGAERDGPFFSHLPRWDLTSRAKLFLAPELKDSLAGVNALAALERDLPEAFAGWDAFSRAQYLESRYLLPGYLLSTQGDRMAMAHGVEGRYPFLDHRVVELASRIPPSLKMRVLQEKYILRRAAGDLIPPALRTRPKQPYRAPDVACFFDVAHKRARFPYVDEMLSPGAIAKAGVFQADAVSRLVDKARAGQVIGVKDGMALVAILSTQLWMHQFILHPGRQADGTAVH